MNRDSFILYNSFYEPIKTLKNEQLGKLLRAIFNYTTNGEITQDDEIIIPFMFIKNQLDIDNKKWQEEKAKRSEAGRLGGIKRAINQKQALSSKSKQCLGTLSNAKQNQANQAVNVNVNDNVNVNENDNDNNIDCFSYYEKQFCRTLSPLEYETISTWQNWYNDDIIKLAIDITILNGVQSMNYTNKIINNWHDKGYTTLEQCKNENKNQTPDWYGKEIAEVKASDKEIEELEEKMKRVLKK